jgi:uncharacterized membrane protein
MRSKFAVRGHPLHPTLVALPPGLFVWALVADLVFLSQGQTSIWYEIAFWTGIAAIIAALIAALPGLGDYITLARRTDAKRIATAHMVLNLAAVALYVIAMVLMLDDAAREGTRLTAVVILHAAGVGLLLVSGWLGGEMVYKHHLAVVPDSPERAQQEQLHHGRRIKIKVRT